MARKNIKINLKEEILSNKKFKRSVFKIVETEVTKQKNIFFSKFDSHPVTKEIETGESSSNISGTLGGYGNLFSFLGFSNGQNPTSSIKSLLKSINLNRQVTVNKNSLRFKVDVPGKEDFAAVSKLPWELGRSWLFDIERTISGLGAYLYGRFKSSRSGGGIQSKYNYSNRTFRPTKYFGEMYKEFINKLKSI